MENYFYCIPRISLTLQTKSQTQLQKSSVFRNFLNSLKPSINTFHACMSSDMLCLYQSILLSHAHFLYLWKVHYFPHIAILKIMRGHNTWCFSIISLAIFISKSSHSKYSLKNKLYPYLTSRREEEKCSYIWTAEWLELFILLTVWEATRYTNDLSWRKLGIEIR